MLESSAHLAGPRQVQSNNSADDRPQLHSSSVYSLLPGHHPDTDPTPAWYLRDHDGVRTAVPGPGTPAAVTTPAMAVVAPVTAADVAEAHAQGIADVNFEVEEFEDGDVEDGVPVVAVPAGPVADPAGTVADPAGRVTNQKNKKGAQKVARAPKKSKK